MYVNDDAVDIDWYSCANTFGNLPSCIWYTHRHSLVRFVDVFLRKQQQDNTTNKGTADMICYFDETYLYFARDFIDNFF